MLKIFCHTPSHQISKVSKLRQSDSYDTSFYYQLSFQQPNFRYNTPCAKL
ncbi:hypothetical protein NHP200010_15410 [Helicobacter bizzozeronii]|nr:hypothetical protein NHP200010_15410 [Helicobacter bizzozeronii]